MTGAAAGGGQRSPDLEREPRDGLRLRWLPAVREPAFPLEHDYFEIAYTPLVGPSAVLLARAMARHLRAAGGPTTVSSIELALEVGIRGGSGSELGQRSHLVRAMGRLVRTHVVAPLGEHVVGVRCGVPPLSGRALRKVPVSTREAHARFVRDLGCDATPED